MYKNLLILLLVTFFAGQVYAQVTVTGQVKDNNGEPVPGANVLLKGTTQGTITDIEGNYSISEIPTDGILVFSFIGMLSQEIKVGEQTVINVTLAEDLLGLDEVVVIGYGTVKKRDLTGSVSSVKATDVVKAPTYNVLEAIQGMVPGMDITRESGSAGSGVNIMLRGTRSIGDPDDEDSYKDLNEPLYIIDGIQGGSISDLNPNDIESIEVLKDASSTAIYGFQGANGVVIITTKRGNAGKPRVSYNAYYGINGFTSYPEIRMGDEYIKLRMEAARNGNPSWNDSINDINDIDLLFTNPYELAAVDTGNWVNWPDLLISNGHQQSHQISIASGNENTQSYLSVGYYREEGILKMDELKRYNARLNLDHNINKWAKSGLNAQITYTDQDRRKDPLSKAMSLAPLGVPYNEDGSVNTDPLGNGTSINPLTDERPNIAVDQSISTNVLTQGYFEITPLEGLSLRTNLGTTIDFNRRGIYNDETSLSGLGGTGDNAASMTTGNSRFINWDNVINYSKVFGNHSFTLTALSSYTQGAYDMVYAGGQNQANASALFYLLESNETQTISSQYIGSKTLSYAGRVNYSYKGKYLFTATNRYDWASMLSSGSRWENFPSVAFAWRISDESFMNSIAFLSDLKVRWSYGLAGNSNIDPYDTQSGISPFTTGFGEVLAIAYKFDEMIGNNSVGWEKTSTSNYGLDIGFFNNRLSANIDVYKSKTSDILLPRDLPTLSGVSKVTQNIGKTENKGFEMAINSYNIQMADFTWKTTLTYSYNQGKIVELVEGDDIISDEDGSLFLGQPLRVFYTYDKLGIWQLGEEEAAVYGCEPGDIKVADLNKNGAIDAQDRLCYPRSPDWIGGMQNVFTYKSVELSVYMFARVGQYIDAEFLGRYNPSGSSNGPAYLEYWTPENPTNDYPRPEWGGQLSNLTGYQALTFVDGSYFKIKNVILGYTLPQTFTRKFLVDKLKVYGTLNNIYTKARSHLIQYYDPERGGSEKAPLSKQLVFGVNVEF